ncbi:ribosomal subunit interface protein [ [[Propionibacterium] namnetense SK182B-JCVI]|uniref:Ribosomal subunit interface protein n=1 Tax=[Propionibacterium] namnetense SK182B-JCVI TaxID=1051006 RepID=F9NSQ9_9ACTN|nr:ribosomal subunit interface protein [ [[Propionibacterium] namnetense SK182B-JCVI]
MEVIVSGRHCHVSDDVRAQVEDRLSGVEKLKDRVQRAEVVFTAQGTKGPKDQAMTCEITLRAKGPVVRAVGQAEDKMVAFDMAADRLRTQLVKAADRRRSRRGLRVSQVLDVLPEESTDDAPDIMATRKIAGDVEVTGDSPMYVKEKVFQAVPLPWPRPSMRWNWSVMTSSSTLIRTLSGLASSIGARRDTTTASSIWTLTTSDTY